MFKESRQKGRKNSFWFWQKFEQSVIVIHVSLYVSLLPWTLKLWGNSLKHLLFSSYSQMNAWVSSPRIKWDWEWEDEGEDQKEGTWRRAFSTRYEKMMMMVQKRDYYHESHPIIFATGVRERKWLTSKRGEWSRERESTLASKSGSSGIPTISMQVYDLLQDIKKREWNCKRRIISWQPRDQLPGSSLRKKKREKFCFCLKNEWEVLLQHLHDSSKKTQQRDKLKKILVSKNVDEICGDKCPERWEERGIRP